MGVHPVNLIHVGFPLSDELGTPLEGVCSVFPAKAQPSLPVDPRQDLWSRTNGNLVAALPGGNGRSPQAGHGGAKKRISILGFLAVSMPQVGKGSPIMPDAPLLVASPSNVRLEPGQTGEASQPPRAAPSAQSTRPRVAGSNSYGDCRHCPSSWALEDGLVPRHADRRVRENGLMRPTCPGSGETPRAYVEA